MIERKFIYLNAVSPYAIHIGYTEVVKCIDEMLTNMGVTSKWKHIDETNSQGNIVITDGTALGNLGLPSWIADIDYLNINSSSQRLCGDRFTTNPGQSSSPIHINKLKSILAWESNGARYVIGVTQWSYYYSKDIMVSNLFIYTQPITVKNPLDEIVWCGYSTSCEFNQSTNTNKEYQGLGRVGQTIEITSVTDNSQLSRVIGFKNMDDSGRRYIPTIGETKVGDSIFSWLSVNLLNKIENIPTNLTDVITTSGVFGSYVNSSVGDMLTGKSPSYEYFVGIPSMCIVGSFGDNVISLNRSFSNGDIVNVNGNSYINIHTQMYKKQFTTSGTIPSIMMGFLFKS